MNHTDIKNHLADYLEGELPIDERALVDAHLDACDSCSDEVEAMLQTIQMLRRLPEPEVPPFIAANVMRRIRSGETELGFFSRLGRTLGAVFEPGFVLPASAVAAAALVVTVVQGVGGFSIPGFGTGAPGIQNERANDRGETSIAALAPSIGIAPKPAATAVDPNGMDFVARVERRATQTNRIRLNGNGSGTSFLLTSPGAQIRIQLNGFGRAADIGSQPAPLQIPLRPRPSNGLGSPFAGPVLASQGADLWTTNFSGGMPGSETLVGGRGALVAADGRAGGAQLTRSAMWPQQSIVQGGFLTGGGNAQLNAEGRDPRDAWLALAFEDPAEFARYIAGRNLAEQELWAARLSERAEMRGLLDELLETLRDSGDATAVWVADDFSAQAELARSFGSEED